MSENSPAFSPSPSLERVKRGDLCSGCGLCAGIAPEAVAMTTASPGYLRPKQFAGLNVDQEKAISTSCPGLSQSSSIDDRTDDVLWGPYISMKTGFATDATIRYAGSSGGALTQILVWLIEKKIVDAVVQTSASPELPIGNVTVVSLDRASIVKAAGSRYAPSAPLSNLAGYVKDGRRFAFVGKPCDVAALRAISAFDQSIAKAFPVVLSFFCAGIPSHTGAKQVLSALGTDLDGVDSFRFRGNGWPGLATASLKNGENRSMSYNESWGQILSKHVQHRCKICADGTGTAADIVCADAWEADEDGYPVFDERDGSSLIVARTPLGENLVNAAVNDGVLAVQTFDVSTLASIQPGQRERRRALFARLMALRLVGKPTPAYRGLNIPLAARQNSLKKNVKNFLGTLRRALLARK